ncbi:hypothetical protein [Effusibacillus consociatus]|uniref:Uncharacterized protein n=1 Tax=Effusibacillus consociatus TaxID=1117041 RepID=A0ABV9Q1X1_9BACL
MKLKQLFTVCLATAVVLTTMGNSSIAAKQQDEKTLDRILSKRGYSQELLAEFPKEQKQAIVDAGATCNSVEKKSFRYNESTGELEEVKPGEITPEGTISTSDLDISITTASLSNQDGYDRYLIQLNWK